MTANATSVVLDLAIFGLVLYRQLQTRPLASGRLPLILAAIGLVELVAYAQRSHLTGSAAAAVGLSLALAALLGAVRATTVRVFEEGGRLLRRGTWLTAALWIASLGIHVGVAAVLRSGAAAVGAATVLYIAVTLGAQQLALVGRARKLGAAG